MDKETVKQSLDYQAFYQAELGELRPGTNGNHLALCPFHHDTKPSLSVNLRTGLFRCFACDAKGDVFDFYQKKHACGFS
ncbi:MAG: DNA primase, partial [Deltaproteobacteria bacterium]|nr:DNA primase [Deltaproteobacteria bacterium]